MLLSIYILFCCWICEKKKLFFCFSLLPFRCTWKYINAGWKSLKVTVVSVFWSTTSTSTSPSHLNGSRNAKIKMKPQTTSVQRNIRLIFHFVDQESLPSAILRWLFGSYQSCNNLSTHSIHENFLRFQSCLIFLQVLSLHIPRKSKYCRRMKTVGPTLLLHEQTLINPVTSLCSKIHRNESLKNMCELFGGEIKELL